MIILVMQHLKMDRAAEVDLETLISLEVFQIYLKIFLVKDLEEEGHEDQIIVVQI